MVVIKYETKYHKAIINFCVHALKRGKIVAYPTDTSYGLAVDAGNERAIKKLYRIKERLSRQPVHVVAPSITFAKTIVKWNETADKLAQVFWPRLRHPTLPKLYRTGGFGGQAGSITLILPLRSKNKELRILSAGTGTLGVRMPKNKIALDLVKHLKSAITTTSANPAGKKGGYDSYSAGDIVRQFAARKHQPDIIINAGKLPKRRPSTMLKIIGDGFKVLRKGSVSEIKIKNVIS